MSTHLDLLEGREGESELGKSIQNHWRNRQRSISVNQLGWDYVANQLEYKSLEALLQLKENDDGTTEFKTISVALVSLEQSLSQLGFVGKTLNEVETSILRTREHPYRQPSTKTCGEHRLEKNDLIQQRVRILKHAKTPRTNRTQISKILKRAKTSGTRVINPNSQGAKPSKTINMEITLIISS
ncbi:hypothetical protein HAX54_020311 [Datura stramonium]|uniref:Uncharacterized protein n=1 Tax=Datura stramonium TaxID=4076 RepID=A0ABS8UTQ9_DATST|nr:hypothetical protein [Datura stramonium]